MTVRVLPRGVEVDRSADDLDIPEFAEPLQRLVKGGWGVWAREPVTAAGYAAMRGVEMEECLGTDAAFLLESQKGASNTVSAFVGCRSAAPSGLVRFCGALARRLASRIKWLPWIPAATCRTHRWR